MAVQIACGHPFDGRALTTMRAGDVVWCPQCNTRVQITLVIARPIEGERAVRRLARGYLQGVTIEESLNEAITLEGDTVTIEALKLEEVTL